jgi:hypothetical protein
MSMMAGHFVGTSLMLLCSLTMVSGSVFVMFSGFFVMFSAFVLGHFVSSPIQNSAITDTGFYVSVVFNRITVPLRGGWLLAPSDWAS